MTAPRQEARKRKAAERIASLDPSDSYYPDASGNLGRWVNAEGSFCHPRDCDARPFGDLHASWKEPSSLPACYTGHKMQKLHENPPNYENPACCDVCGLPSLMKMYSHFFHCSTCKFDKCPSCAANSVEYKPKSRVGVKVLQDTSVIERAAAAAAIPGRTFFSSSFADAWRVWTCAAALARYLEAQHESKIGNIEASLQRPVALELGAGSALVSLVLVRLGTHDVIVTDQHAVLPLIYNGFISNFSDREFTPADLYTPCCPAHGPLPAAHLCKETKCSVCFRLQDDVKSCHCGFGLCCSCRASVVCGDVGRLPCWFQVCCKNSVRVKPLQRSVANQNPSFFVRPLDWREPENVAVLRSEMEIADLKPPSLILASDAVTSKDLVKDFVNTLLRLQAWTRSALQPCTLLLAEEARQPIGLHKQLREHGLKMQRIASHEVVLEGRGMVSLWQVVL